LAILSPVIYAFLALKRYVRYLPLFALVLVYEWKILPNMSSYGPLSATDLNCSRNKFFDTLFLRNNEYAGTDTKMCSPWLWYLKVDFELFLTVPIIVLISKLAPKVTIFFVNFLALGCSAWTAYVCQTQGIHVLNNFDGLWAVKVMNKSYLRGTCYFWGVGIALYLELKRKNSSKKNFDDDKRDSGLKENEEILNQTMPVYLPSSTNKPETLSKRPKSTQIIIKPIEKSKFIMTKSTKISTFFSLTIFISTGAILYKYFQVTRPSQNIPIVYHTIYNTLAGPLFAISTFKILHNIIKSTSKIEKKFRLSPTYMIYRAIYFEVFMVHMAFILTRNFSWEVLSSLTPRFVNRSLPSDMIYCVVISLFFLFFVTEPCKNIWHKVIELPLVYNVWPGWFEIDFQGENDDFCKDFKVKNKNGLDCEILLKGDGSGSKGSSDGKVSSGKDKSTAYSRAPGSTVFRTTVYTVQSEACQGFDL